MAITLKAARINVGLTQTEAAKKIGVSTDTLGNWERGKNFPNVQALTLIERVYKVDYKDLIFLPSHNA